MRPNTPGKRNNWSGQRKLGGRATKWVRNRLVMTNLKHNETSVWVQHCLECGRVAQRSGGEQPAVEWTHGVLWQEAVLA